MSALGEWWSNLKKNIKEEFDLAIGRCPICGEELAVRKLPMAPQHIYDAFDLLDMCPTRHFARTRFYDYIKEHRGSMAEDVIHVAEGNLVKTWIKPRE